MHYLVIIRDIKREIGWVAPRRCQIPYCKKCREASAAVELTRALTIQERYTHQQKPYTWLVRRAVQHVSNTGTCFCEMHGTPNQLCHSFIHLFVRLRAVAICWMSHKDHSHTSRTHGWEVWLGKLVWHIWLAKFLESSHLNIRSPS